MKIFHLVVYNGATICKVFVLNKERCWIGRDPGCDLVLESMEVSRRHALVRCIGDEVTIEDMGSTNGIMVNGEPVSAVHTLQLRDEIFLGRDFRLVFQVVDSQRFGKKDESGSELRPAYPVPLPQTMILTNDEFESSLEVLQRNQDGEVRRESISPPTIPQKNMKDVDLEGET